MPKTKVDRLAHAKANGYERGAQGQWASQDSDMNKKDCLCEGQPAPDLATIKDFIRYYIFSTQGMLSIRQTVSSVLNFAERFFARFTHVTKTTFDKKDAEDVYYWIRKTLIKEDIIENKKRTKHMFTYCDLTNIIFSMWTDDDPVFIHKRHRIQMTFAILIYCYSGARIGAFIPDMSKADYQGLRYEDIELYLYCRPDGEKEIFFCLSQKWVKNNHDPKNTVFRVVMREHGKLRFNPVPYLLMLAFADNTLFSLDNIEALDNMEPDGRAHLAAVEAMCSSLQRGLANKIDKIATEAERGQLLNQTDPHVYGCSYIANTSALSSMDALKNRCIRTISNISKGGQGLVYLYTWDYDVVYRPGEEPLGGICPARGCNFSLQIQQELSLALGCRPQDLEYCYKYVQFVTKDKWEEHCKGHLESISSQQCEIITYCHTLIRPGYCLFCLGDSTKLPSRRMKPWTRSNELKDHIESDHLMDAHWPQRCRHPMCNQQDLGKMALYYHLSDIHGLHNAIWNKTNRPMFKVEDTDSEVDAELNKTRNKRQPGKIDIREAERRRPKG
ncbi:hypothetical protein T310_0806 [Rasamsonia emersonii CBS 393.64]|uniref:Uncharacterized protein n=1 Tax=Rasamsonia emersonii (strain ATCC 16479 / CBS 393.64 / IMI 116815) TaxID=1408163 RepID=A0A0F4Z519_RASE3|nr:hypothetical protein T310_0806 [Rasamsonia emersonii CBS 393.64]KKA25166.1 hypothetical protein T310_0806 [Rasamsonia emersonii CBS 393.64]